MCYCCCSDCILVIIAIFFPPLPVWIRRGVCSVDSLINILLCVLGYVPGLIHSWYIISKYPSDVVYYDEEQRLYIAPNQVSNVTYVRVVSPSVHPVSSPPHCDHVQSSSSQPQISVGGQSYGSTGQSAPLGPPPAYEEFSASNTGGSRGKN